MKNRKYALILAFNILLCNFLFFIWNPISPNPGALYAQSFETLPGTTFQVNTTLGPGTYLVTGDLVIPKGVTLTIEPDTVLKFNSFYRTIEVAGGILRAEGTTTKPIVFTAAGDNAYGCSISGQKSPQANDWGGLIFRWSLDGTTTAQGTLTSCIFRYGGGEQLGLVEIWGTSPHFEHTTFEFSGQDGMYMNSALINSKIYPSNPFVKNCSFNNNKNDGIYADHDSTTPATKSQPEIISCCFKSNVYYAMHFEDNVFPFFDGCNQIIFAENSLNGIGRYGEVNASGMLSYPGKDFAYIISEDLVVANGAILTIEPGVIIKANYWHRTMSVRGGKLFGCGQAGEKIYFTSYYDDSLGGDTNGDGIASGCCDENSPQSGDWGGLIFDWSDDGTKPSDGILNYCVFRYSGGEEHASINIRGCSPWITNSIIELSGRDGITMIAQGTHTASPVLKDNIVRNNYNAGVYCDSGSMPTLTGNLFTLNDWGVVNVDTSLCINAGGNDWGHPSGPFDDSNADDCVKALGYTFYNPSGLGNRVSDFVIYDNWLQPSPGVPNAPTNLAVEVINTNSGLLTWQDNSDNEEGFKLECKKETENSFKVINSIPQDATIALDPIIQEGSLVVYRIVAYNDQGNSHYSNEAVVHWSSVSLPQADFETDFSGGQVPLDVTFTDKSQGIVAKWTWYFGDGQTSREQNPVHTYTVAGIYTVALVVEGPGGRDTEIKEGFLVVINENDRLVSNLTASIVNNSQINLNWDDLCTHESGFDVLRCINCADPNQISQYEIIAHVGPNMTSYTDTNCTEGNIYYYLIKTVLPVVDSFHGNIYSNSAEAVVNECNIPPDGLIAEVISENDIILTWIDNSSCEIRYEIFRRGENESNYTLIDTLQSNTNTYIDTSAEVEVKYFYQVKAIRSIDESASSNIAETSISKECEDCSCSQCINCFISILQLR